MDKINIGDIYKFRTGEVGMVINEKVDYYSILCEDGKIQTVGKTIPYTYVDLDKDTLAIFKEYREYLFEKKTILKRIEIENNKLFQIENTLTDIQLKLRLKGSKYKIKEFIQKVTEVLNKDLISELNEKCSVDMTYQSGCFRIEIYQEKCISNETEYSDIIVPETVGGSETGYWVLNEEDYDISEVCKELYKRKDILKFNIDADMQNIMTSEEKDIFVYDKDAYFYHSTIYRFRAQKLTDDLIDIIKKVVVKRGF